MQSALPAFLLSFLLTASAASAREWSGPYLGSSFGAVHGDWQHFDLGSVFNSGDYSAAIGGGLLAGYNFHSGATVYGAEVAVSRTRQFCFTEYPAECTDNLFDLKGRFGLAAGSAMIFGILGLSQAEYDDGESKTLRGTAFGFGVDCQISDRYFLGGEVLRRNFEGDLYWPRTTEQDITSFTLRLGLKF